MYTQNEHPRRNFMFFCFGVFIVGALAGIICERLSDELSGDTAELVYALGLPLIALPVCYLVFYRYLTKEDENAVTKHLKEIGIWLIFVFPLGGLIYAILDSADFEFSTDLYISSEYFYYLVLCSLSIIFVTPFFKLGRMIFTAIRNSNMKDNYSYYQAYRGADPRAQEQYYR